MANYMYFRDGVIIKLYTNYLHNNEYTQMILDMLRLIYPTGYWGGEYVIEIEIV